MDKINFNNLPNRDTAVSAPNLNTMQNNIEKSVNYIGSTQPSTGENVWLKTGKNLFNKNNVINGYRFGSDGSLYADSDFSATDFIEVNSSTQYTVSWVIQIVQCVCYYDENKNFISRNGSEKTFTTPSNCKYIRASVLTSNINSAQIELGSSSTTYEPYIDKEILVKNNVGVFEKFYNEEEINQENYSLGEQRIGIWIDGKPIYRKVITFNSIPSNSTSIIADVSSLNIDTLVKLYGALKHYQNTSYRVLPMAGGGTDDIRIDINENNLRITTYSNWAGFSNNFICIEYTKTTD